MDTDQQMLGELLAIQSLRFFLFDFVLFKSIREKLEKKSWIFRKMFSCPFCNGFWTTIGLRTFLLIKIKARNKKTIRVITLDHFIDTFLTGIVSGFISITWFSLIIPLIEEMELLHAKESGWINYDTKDSQCTFDDEGRELL